MADSVLKILRDRRVWPPLAAVLVGLGAAGAYWAGGPPPVTRSPSDTLPEQLPAAPAQATPGSVIRGVVAESKNASRYTYLRIRLDDASEVWAAVPAVQVEAGSSVEVRDAQKMENFSSPSLGRTFPVIYFGVMGHGDEAPQPAGSTAGEWHDPHAMASAEAPDVVPGRVAKAPGPDGHTVAEIVDGRVKLSGRTVRVRGVVVKSTAGVLGRTFVHLRDGSGDPARGNNDLVVTLEATPKVGDTLLVEGKVVVDRDFGSGYRYDAILEDGKALSE